MFSINSKTDTLRRVISSLKSLISLHEREACGQAPGSVVSDDALFLRNLDVTDPAREMLLVAQSIVNRWQAPLWGDVPASAPYMRAFALEIDRALAACAPVLFAAKRNHPCPDGNL